MAEIKITCPKCFQSFSTDSSLGTYKCTFCDEIINVQSFKQVKKVAPAKIPMYINTIKQIGAQCPNDPSLYMSLGLFYLESKAYMMAVQAFQWAISMNPYNPDAYFYYAVSLLGGKRPYESYETEMRNVLEKLNVAISINPNNPQYYFFKAFIAKDFYEKNFLPLSPSSSELLNTAQEFGLTEEDEIELFDMLKVQRPRNF